ncbi:MAG: hypothetical protein DRP85_06410, partial [Candidatus Makaraimicrobium thalassicum]
MNHKLKNKKERKSQVSAVTGTFFISFILLFIYITHAASLDIFRIYTENKTNLAGEPVNIYITGPNSTNYTMNIYNNHSLILSEPATTSPQGRYIHRPNLSIPGRYTANLSKDNLSPTLASTWFNIILPDISGNNTLLFNQPIHATAATKNTTANDTQTDKSITNETTTNTNASTTPATRIHAISSETPDIQTTQLNAEISLPVKWLMTIKNSTHITLPETSTNICIKNIPNGTEKVNITPTRTSTTLSSTSGKELILDENSIYDIEYETPAPIVTEKIITSHKKQVTISSGIHYTNILAYTNITETKKEMIKLYWLTNNTKTQFKDITYTDTNDNLLIDKISWVIPHLSNQTFEIEIKILNIQSYPQIRGNWTVRFNTTGTANLTIRTANDTTWNSTNEDNDLKFLELKCGNASVQYEWINNSVFVKNYECNETSYEVSKVLTSGKHTLEFRFGDDVEYAHNTVFQHFIARRVAQQTKNSGNWGYISGTAGTGTTQSTQGWIDGSNFNVGDRYLIMVWGAHNTDDGQQRSGIRVMHSGSAFPESQCTEETDRTGATYKTPYFWFTIWTGADEDIDVQYYRSGGTARVEDVTLVAINVEDLINADDLQYNIDTSGGTLGGWSTKASITWTPSYNGDTWWIGAYTRADIFEAGGNDYEVRLSVDGTTRAQSQIEGEDTADTPVYGHGWAQTFDDNSHTVNLQIREDGTNQQWEAAGVFALRLNVFVDFAISAIAGTQAIARTSSWSKHADVAYTPQVSGNWLVAGGFIADDNNARVTARISDDIATSDLTDIYGGWQHNTNDWIPWTGADMTSFDTTSQNLGLYAQETRNANADARDTWMVAFSMERREVNWNQSTLNLGSGYKDAGTLTGSANISSTGSNTDVNVTCTSGNCSEITEIWSDTTDMTHGQNLNVTFECSDAALGTLWAIFNVTSNEDSIPNQINVSCEITDGTPPTITAGSPQNTSYSGSSIWFNVTLNEPGDWCAYSLDAAPNITIVNSSGNWNKQNSSMTEGSHHVTFSCNDTSGNMNTTGPLYFTLEPLPPDIAFKEPTPYNNKYISENHTYINLSISDAKTPGNLTALIDWNRSLVGWWRFNNETSENTTFFRDWSTWSNNATCAVGNCSNYTTGKFGQGLKFDGENDYLTIPDHDSLTPSSLTLSVWFKGTSSNNYAPLIGKRSAGNREYTLLIDCDGPPVPVYDLYVYDQSESAYIGIRKLGSIGICDGNWHHLTGTWDGGTDSTSLKLYKDGTQLTGTTTSDDGTFIALENLDSDILIGKASWSGNAINGTIDEVKIYSRALSPEEINASYNTALYRLYCNFTNLEEGTYTYTAYAQDLAGKVNQTETRTITIDQTHPKYSQNQTNSTQAGADILFSLYWEDNIDLAGYTFSFDNGTGTFENSSYENMSGTADWSNIIKIVNSTPGAIIRWRIYANDTAGNANTSETYSFQPTDTVHPVYSNVNQNTTGNVESDQDVMANSTWSDNIGISTVLFRSNHTGTWSNYTIADSICSQDGNEYYCTIPNTELSLGEVVGWNYWANDTFSNWNQSMPVQVFTVVQDASAPNITDVNATPNTIGLGKLINIKANVTDSNGIHTVKVNITLPDSSTEIYEMTNYTKDIYEYNYTAWQTGSYYYSIWANDTFGNVKTYDPYFYACGNATIDVYTANKSYSSNENVTLAQGDFWNSDDLENSIISKYAPINTTNNETADTGIGAGGDRDDGFTASELATQNCGYGTCDAGDSWQYGDRNGDPINLNVTFTYDLSNIGIDGSDIQNMTFMWGGCWHGGNARDCGGGDDPEFNGCSGTMNIFVYDGSVYEKMGNSYTICGSGDTSTDDEYNIFTRYKTSGFTDSYLNGNDEMAIRINTFGDTSSNGADIYHVLDFAFLRIQYKIIDEEENTSFTEYTDINLTDYNDVIKITVTVEIDSYNPGGSASASNKDPDLNLGIYDGSSYNLGNYLNLNQTYTGDSLNTTNANFTIAITNQTILDAWKTGTNRDIELRGIYMDAESGNTDEINYTNVWVDIIKQQPSQLENTGSTNISGYLLMTVQTNISGSWTHVSTVLDDTETSTQRNISSGDTMDLASIWNADPWNTDSNQVGWYRVCAALTDDEGNILQGDNGNYINDTDNFEIVLFTFSNIIDTPDPQGYGEDVTIQTDIKGGTVHTALVEITRPDSTKSNFTMTNISATTWQYNFSGTWQWGQHTYRIYANDSTGSALYSSGNTFNININAKLNVITQNKTYGPNEYINLTRYPQNWWNTSWNYRIPITVSTGNHDRNDTIISAYFNFTQRLSALGVQETFDNYSIRLIEYSGDNALHELNSTFKNSTDYNAAANAVGEVIFSLNGTNLKNTERTFHIYFDTTNDPKSAPNYDMSYINSKITPSGESVDALNIYGDVGGHFVPANITIETMDKGTFIISIYDKDADSGSVGLGFYLYHPNGSYYSELGSNTDTYNNIWTNYTINAGQSGSWHMIINQTGAGDNEYFMLRTYGVNNLNFANNLNKEVDEYKPHFGGSSTHNHYVFIPEGITTFTVSNFDMDNSGSIAYYYPNGTLYATGTISGNGNWQDDIITTGGVWGYWNIRVVVDGGVGGYDVLARTTPTNYLPLSWKITPLWVPQNPPQVTKNPAEQLDRVSKIVNIDTKDTKTYLLMKVQHWTGTEWENTGFPTIDQTHGTYNIPSSSRLYLDTLWDSKGGWNTNTETPGTYRVYVAMINHNSNILKDPSGSDLYTTYNFTILSSYLELTNLTHENEYEHSVNEYETGDNIDWINITITNHNATAINANITSNILDHSSSKVTWGLDETSECGNIPVGGTCEKRFDNSTNGYLIPLDATAAGEYDFYWNITMSSECGTTTENSSLSFKIHHMPDNFTSIIDPEKIYQNKSSTYNITITNSWSKNLTSVNITVNCPLNLGFTCNCSLAGQETRDYCYLENITGNSQKTASFNISTYLTPAEDYNINATVNYTNPGGETHTWIEQKNQLLKVRIPGQLVNITSYPTKVTRTDYSNLTGLSNNTLATDMTDVWINWTLVYEWSNSTGNLNTYEDIQSPSEIVWNNITVYFNLSSALGPQNIELYSTCAEGFEDWDIVAITIYANTSLTNPGASNNDPLQGETIQLSTTLVYDNGTAIANQNITFNDTTTGSFIGWDLTDSGGLAAINYVLSPTETLGNHTINISYAGKNSPHYTNPASETINITVHDKPLIISVTDSPDPQGYGYNISFSANVTDYDGVDLVWIHIKPPDGSYTAYAMTNYSQDIYEYNYTNTWTNGQHSYYIQSSDNAGKTNQTQIYYFIISSNATLDIKTEKDSYGPTEYVNLTDSHWWNDNWNYRSNIIINTSDYPRTKMYISRTINFTQLMNELSISGTFDNNSIRVIEWNETSQTNTEINSTVIKVSAPDPDLWDMSQDTPQPVDFNSGLNYTSNTFGTGADNDGWDWADDIYDDLPTTRPDGAIEDNTSSSLFSSDGALRVRIGGIVSGTTEGSGSYESGAHGIQFDVTGDMYRVIENSGYANISFLYSMNATAGTAEDTIIYSRFNLNYLGSDQCWDSRNDIKCYGNSRDNQDTSWQTATFNVTDYITGPGWYYLDFGAALQGWNAASDGIDVFFDNITMKFYGNNYNLTENAVLNITWVMNGTTPANKVRNYYIYYDLAENGAKDTATYSLTGSTDSNPINITEQSPQSRPSTLHNNATTRMKGYLTMKIQRFISNIWQDITGGTIIDNQSYNLSSGISTSLDNIWNPVPWYTDKQPPGTYRAFAYLADPAGSILKNDDNSGISGYYPFEITPPPSIIQIREIRIYDVTNAGDMKTDTSILTGSGLNTTFDLYTEKYYRAEIILWNNDTSEENWTISASDTIYHNNLNAIWNISPSANIWYSNSTTIFNGESNWSSGRVSWNTSQSGIVPVNENATFSYIFNINTTTAEVKSVHYIINSTMFTREDHSTYNIIASEDIPPKLYNNNYGTNASIINRGDDLLTYAQWDETINTAKAEYNSTTAQLTNHTIALPYTGHWTNHTITTNTSWLLGTHKVKIYSADLNSNWNTTLPYLTFEVWGWANISESSLNPTTIIQGNTTVMKCKVLSDKSQSISGYTVSFYNSTGLLGTNQTNSTGWAQWNFTDNSLGYETITCNITGDPSKLYNATTSNNRQETLRTIETEAPKYSDVSQNTSVLHKGDQILYKAYWTDNILIDYTWLETNATDSWQNNSLADILHIGEGDDWSNFIATIPMTMNPGHLAWRIYANDSSSNINVTTINITEVWGWAELKNSNLNPTPIYVTNSTIFSCQVTDANGSAIFGYTISFYNSTGLLGTNQTDVAGWAQWNYTDNSTGSENLVCNITGDAGMLYNASETYYQKTESLYTATVGEDTTPPSTKLYDLNDTVLWKSDHTLIYALWSEPIGDSNTEYNSTSPPLMNYTTETISGNWTNHTIATNSNWIAGKHAARLNASDQATPANWNNSLEYKYFDVWGRSKVYWNAPTGSTDRGTSIQVSCTVRDKDNSEPIEGYTVNFYDNDWVFLNSDNTNASGIAEVNWNSQSESVGSKTLHCTISNAPGLYYNTTATDDDALGSITLIGNLNVTILNPLGAANQHTGDTIWLNSTTEDDNSTHATPDSASWKNTTAQIAAGENTTWTIPHGHSLGPETIYVNVTKTGYNSDEKNITIYIWGWSNISWQSPAPGNDYTQGSTIPLICSVFDKHTTDSIENYTVNFYIENETQTWYLGNANTNSTGSATYNWYVDANTYSNTTYYPKCNITDNTTLYYNASISFEDNTTINITSTNGAFEVSLIIPPELSTTQVAQNRNLTVNATVKCINGPCGTVNGTIQYSNQT